MTTVGRLILNDVLPAPLTYKNHAFTKDAVKQLIAECLEVCGPQETVQMADALKRLGFHYATRSGISFALSDIEVPTEKYERAAQLYHQYATTAIASRFDLKLTFAKASNRPHGERVVMSERAIRRAMMLYGSLQNTAMVDQVYSEYYKRMRKLAGDWQPSQATLTELANAKSRTNAFRLPAQQMLPHEAVLPETDGKGHSDDVL